jgi:hypothetical protein
MDTRYASLVYALRGPVLTVLAGGRLNEKLFVEFGIARAPLAMTEMTRAGRRRESPDEQIAERLSGSFTLLPTGAAKSALRLRSFELECGGD